MKEVLSWIVEHYELLILVGACLLDIVLFLFGVFKKKKDLSLEEIINHIPHLVICAEKHFGSGNGLDKKRYVLEILLELYYASTGVRLSSESETARIFDYAIEKVLETPQKKGK